MSNFIQQTDYLPYITEKRLSQAIGGDTNILTAVENTAIQIIKDALHPKYDVEAVFDTSGSDRPAQILRWSIILSVYYLHERIPDALIPERITAAYDETMDTLRDIADGKKSILLPRALDNDSNIKTKIRWGSETKRQHNIN
jgi:hypothetical protein